MTDVHPYLLVEETFCPVFENNYINTNLRMKEFVMKETFFQLRLCLCMCSIE